VSAPELAPFTDKYLADPLTNRPAGAERRLSIVNYHDW